MNQPAAEQPMSIEQLMDAMLRERWREVWQASSQDQSPESTLLVLEAGLNLGEESAPEVLRQIYELLEQEQLPSSVLQGSAELGLRAVLAMRDRSAAERWLKHVEQLASLPPAFMDLARVRIALTFDEREQAKSLLQPAPDEPSLRACRAELAYIEGDFDGALALLQPLLSGDFDVNQKRALRLAAQAHSAQGDFEGEIRQLDHLLKELPDGQRTPDLRLELAMAHASRGEETGLRGAQEQLEILAAGDPDKGITGYAKRRLEYLEKARREDGSFDEPVRLSFPTVHQKRNFCGPAVLELCLRSLGIELSQDEIAGVVKREAGTPMYEIAAFLDAREIESRRIVASLDKLRAALDLGLPVIIQEEYSTTSHVAVLIGYDERLGLFVCQDPMTHRAELKSFEWVQNSGQLFGNGVVVVVGRKENLSAELLKQLDEAGLVSHPAFAVLDEVDRMRAASHGEQQEDAVVEEVLAGCARALREDPDYQLAWYRRAWAHIRRYRDDRQWRDEALRTVHMSRVRWPGAEWPHQIHAALLEQEGRWREAFVEHLSAHRCDPADGQNLAAMAYALGRLGDVEDGIKYSQQALRLMPDHSWICAELAVQYVQALEAECECAWTDEEATGWLKLNKLRPAATSNDLHVEQLLARAHFYADLALEQNVQSAPLLVAWCTLPALDDDWETSLQRLQLALEKLPDDPNLLQRVVRVALLAEDVDAAQPALAKLLEEHASSSGSWLAAAEAARKDSERAWQILLDGVKAVGSDRSELVSALWEAGEELGGGSEAAAVLLSELAHQFENDETFVHEIADKVDEEGQRGLALQLYRKVVENEPGDLNSRYRLGVLLSEDPLTQEEGRKRLQEVVSMAPASTSPRVRLAWCMLEEPQAALQVLVPVMDEGDPYVFETASHLFKLAGNAERAAECRGRALGCFASEHDGRVDLANWHTYLNRYERAIELLKPLTEVPFAGTGDVEQMQDAVLTAHRLGGRIAEISDWARGLCEPDVPSHLAWEIYWGFRSIDRALAGRAARVQAQDAEEPEQVLEFEANAADCDAQLGDRSALEQLTERLTDGTGLDEDAELEAWSSIYHANIATHHYDEAERALLAMRELNPDARPTLTVEEDHALFRGDADGALAAAKKLRELYPFQHMGDERLGILHALAGDTELAAQHAARAIQIAPYCHISQFSAAMAYFADGNIEQARLHMERSEALDPLERPLEWSPAAALLHALRGEREKLETCIADRARTIKEYPFPEFDLRLREVAASG